MTTTATIIETETMMTLENAIVVADDNNRADPEWSYKIVRVAQKRGYAFVEVYDDLGIYLGRL